MARTTPQHPGKNRVRYLERNTPADGGSTLSWDDPSICVLGLVVGAIPVTAAVVRTGPLAA